MEKIYLIQQTTVFEDKNSHEWSTVYAVKNLEQAEKDIKDLRKTEERNRLTRMEIYNDVLYKVYYKVQDIELF